MTRHDCQHECLTVLSRSTDGDPPHPIVTCPHCGTRWIGHLEQPREVPTNEKPLFSDAARDALLSGQDRRALRLILMELDLVPAVMRPNVCLPVTVDAYIDPGQTAQIAARPQVGKFRGTHLLIHPQEAARFVIEDLLVRNRSQLPTAGSIPALQYACNLSGEIVMSPGERSSGASFSVNTERHHVDLSPFAWDMEPVSEGSPIMLLVTNRSEETSQFHAWILGRQTRWIRKIDGLEVEPSLTPEELRIERILAARDYGSDEEAP